MDGHSDYELSRRTDGKIVLRGPENQVRNVYASDREIADSLWRHARQRALMQLRGEGGADYTDNETLEVQLVPAARQSPCATGEWLQANKKTRTYSQELEYDANGNVVSKMQTDTLVDGNKRIPQFPTTYSFTRTYPSGGPHQATGARTTTNTGVVQDTYRYDLNGNLTGIVDPAGKYIRQVTWDV